MTPEQQQAVLAIARRALTQALRGGEAGGEPDVELPTGFSGCFVTLKQSGQLRGCMGTFKPLGTLAETIDRVTRMSCSDDPRFSDKRIRADELADIDVEISVLDQPRLTDDPASLVVGRHGVWIHHGASSGCLLPQVAVERGWSAEELLTQCCVLKAGLPPDAWKDPGTEVRLFEAEIIRQPAPGVSPSTDRTA